MELLTRDEFREAVFARDGYKCVMCDEKAEDAHHILERRLWDDGGYYKENGASLCHLHHLQAEQTLLSCEKIREAAKIEVTALPSHFYDDTRYDKWGNIILTSGLRLRGELYYDISVQKALRFVLDQFSPYVKYPRTYHLPWSPEVAKDDRVLDSVEAFEGRDVVVTVKMDGENTSMYRDHIHARSLDSKGDISRDWVKNFHASFAHEIPEGWRICGENLFEKHSIKYTDIPSFFMVFSIWNEVNKCISWKETVEWCRLMSLEHVPVLYEGPWEEETIRQLMSDSFGENEMEGYVVRLTDQFTYGQFRRSVAKCVRKGHVRTHGRKTMRKIVKNELRK